MVRGLGVGVKDIGQRFQSGPIILSVAIINIEGLMEKDKESTRREEDMGSNLMKRGKKRFLITVACPRMLAQYRSKPFSSPA